MNVVVVGAGEVGFHIASILSREGHDVALIDRDQEAIERATQELDVLSVMGNGASKSVLQRAQIAKASILIAVTDSDEVNMIACMAAKHVGVPLTISRIRNEDYLDEADSVSTDFTGIDYVIQPESTVAQEISSLADLPGALDVETFADGQVHMLEVQVAPDSPGANSTLLSIGLPRNVLVTAILQGEEMMIPTGSTVVRPGDRVFIAGKHQGVLEAASLLTPQQRPSRTAIILGVGEMGLRVARALEAKGVHLTIFEKDYDRSVEAAAVLERSLVLHDEGLSETSLLNEGVRDADLFITATGDDRLNIMASLLAKRLGARRTISIVERPEFSAILETVGVDVAISPRRIVASAVLRFVRTGEVLSAGLLDKSAGEVIELVVKEGSPIAGRPLHETHFPQNAIVGVLVQEDGVHIAHGTSVPHAGNIAIVFTLPEAVPDVERLFTP